MADRKWKTVFILLLLVAIAHHGLYVWKVAVLNHDKSEMVGAAVSLLEGGGYTYVVANPNQLAEPIHSPLIARPPGYTLLLLPVLWVTNDIWLATVLLDVVATIIFYGSWFAIVNGLGPAISRAAKLFIWIMWAIIWSPLMQLSSPELMTVALFSAALAITLRFASRQPHPIRFGVASGILMGAVSALRLAYWPLLVVIPLSLWFSQARRPSQRMMVGVGVHVLIVTLMLAAVLIFQRSVTGQFLHLPVVPGLQRGFYPDQLTSIYPFPTTTIGADLMVEQLQSMLGLPGVVTEVTLWIISGLILGTALYQLVGSFRKSEREELPTDYEVATRCFAVMAISTGVLTLLMLAYMSASYPVPVALRDGRLWISLSRFYVPILPFLLVYLAAVLFPAESISRGSAFKLLRVACFIVVVPTIALAAAWQVPFWYRTFGEGPPVSYADENSRAMLNSLRQIAASQPELTTTLIYPAEGVEQLDEQSVGITDRDGFLANLGRMTGVGTMAANYLPVLGLDVAKNSQLLIYRPHDPHTRDGRWLANFCDRFDATKIPATDEFDWYTLKVDEQVLRRLPEVEAVGLLEIAARRTQARKLDEALSLYQTALAWNPFLLDTHMGLGKLLLKQQRFAEAEASFATAIQLKPDYAEAYKQLGMALLAQGRSQPAAQNFGMALILNPNDAETRERLQEAEASGGQSP